VSFEGCAGDARMYSQGQLTNADRSNGRFRNDKLNIFRIYSSIPHILKILYTHPST
jgi:hypothetical protein